MATVYIFIRNTGAIKYRVNYKLVTVASYNPADFFFINATGGTYTADSSHTLPNANVDYNLLITPICANGKEGSPFDVYIPAACLGVDFEAAWNNCNCPSITNITIET